MRCSLHCDPPDVGEGVALRKVVGVPFPEDVAHPAAGHDLQAPTAHPHPEGELCRDGSHQDGKEPLGKSPRSEGGKELASLAFGVSLEAYAGVRAPGPVYTGCTHSLHVFLTASSMLVHTPIPHTHTRWHLSSGRPRPPSWPRGSPFTATSGPTETYFLLVGV